MSIRIVLRHKPSDARVVLAKLHDDGDIEWVKMLDESAAAFKDAVDACRKEMSEERRFASPSEDFEIVVG